jgi:tetratricopeptide (TPR) repeat protein
MISIRQALFYLFIGLLFCCFLYGGTLRAKPITAGIDAPEEMSVVQLLKQSRERVAANNLSEALRYARLAISVDPAYGDAWKQLGRILMLQGNHTEALSSFQTALVLKPVDEETAGWILRAQVLAAIKSGHFTEATKMLETVLKSKPGDEDTRQLLADVYAAQVAGEKGSDTAEILMKIITLEPKRSGAWRDLGWVLFTKNRFEEAVQAWERALQDKQFDGKALVEQAMASLAEKKEVTLVKKLWQHWAPGSPFLPLGLRYIALNRLIAAREILTMAWEAGEDPVICGLYLAYTESRAGSCVKAYDHLRPYADKGPALGNRAQIETYLSAVRTCSFEPNMWPLVASLRDLIDKYPDLAGKIIDAYEKAGNERQAVRDFIHAYDLLEIVLTYDPNRVRVWPATWELAKNTGREEKAKDLLVNVLKRTSSSAVREGIEGFFAEEQKDLSSAVDHYKKSLAVVPDQPSVRFLLFNDLITLKRYPEAQIESDWFAGQVASGNTTVKAYLANSMSSLGKTAEALEVWQELHLTMPENPYYAIETARGMFLMCRADEAVAILEQLIDVAPTVKAFELLAEIESTLGRIQKAFDVTTAGLALQTSPTLLRIRAEAADTIGASSDAQTASQVLLKTDAGNVSMSLVLGRALHDQKLLQESVRHYEGLLERNPAFLPGLMYLRNYYSSEKVPDKALIYAREMAGQRPWDLVAGQLLALSQVEDDDFRTALRYLRNQASEDIQKTTPILIYDNVLKCPYGGRNNMRQVVSHLERLAAEGYRFVTPENLDNPDKGRRVIVVVTETEASVVEQLDATLKKVNGKAIYAIHPEVLRTVTPGYPSPSMLASMKASGRWTLASSGAVASKTVVVNSAGTKGNPLTHRAFAESAVEGPETLKKRLDNELDSGVTGPDSPKIFLYPKGDYGQLSLDTDKETIETLRGAVGNHYRYGITADDRGFAAAGFDALRLPGRYVPPEWAVDDLTRHLSQDNPLVRARLELAKTLYLHSQHERANAMFAKANDLGANPEEVNFFWGSNANIQGDLPTALEKLRLAHKINPESERDAQALSRVEKKKQPLVNAGLYGWKDSDDRNYISQRVNVESHVTDRLLLKAFTERNRWSRDGMGSEDGDRFGVGGRWYFKEQYWLDANLWYMDIPRVNGYFGGAAALHIPNERLGGYVNLEAGRDEVDTVEAVREKITADSYAVRTYSRILDVWDLYADLSYTHYTDGNDSATLEGIFMRRLHEWPFLGAGYRFRFGHSSRNPDEYWSPQNLQQHEAYIGVRGQYGSFHYTASAEAGMADDASSGWRFVWGARLDLSYFITPQLSLNGRYSRRETPNYNRDDWILGVNYRF